MSQAPLVTSLARAVFRVLRRESPYRYEEDAVREVVADLMGSVRAPMKQRGKIVRRAASLLMRVDR